MNKNTKSAGIDLIKKSESLELEAYPDPASPLGEACTARKVKLRDYRNISGWEKLDGKPWTIGYGHTGDDVFQGLKIDKLMAEMLLKWDIEKFEKTINSTVKIELNDNQFDALISLVYNIGPEEFKTSTILKLINAGDMVGASNQFGKWIYSRGKVLPGLVTRRQEEKTLFLTPKSTP